MTVKTQAGEDHETGSSLIRTEVTLLGVGLVLLVLSALAVADENVPDFERIIFRAVNGLPGLFYWPVGLVMQLGNGLAIAAVAIVALGSRRFRLAVGLGIAGLLVYGLAIVVKWLVHRPRPGALLADVHLRGAHAAGNGYPSGHAAVAFALAVIAWLWFGPRLRWAFLAAAVAVCVGRVYVGAHLPLDVVGGAAMGVISGAFVGLVLHVRRHGHEDRRARLAADPASSWLSISRLSAEVRRGRTSDDNFGGPSVAAVSNDGGNDPEQQHRRHAEADHSEGPHDRGARRRHPTGLAGGQ
jgi:membrane-associated phospholipid phosphatase